MRWRLVPLTSANLATRHVTLMLPRDDDAAALRLVPTAAFASTTPYANHVEKKLVADMNLWPHVQGRHSACE